MRDQEGRGQPYGCHSAGRPAARSRAGIPWRLCHRKALVASRHGRHLRRRRPIHHRVSAPEIGESPVHERGGSPGPRQFGGRGSSAVSQHRLHDLVGQNLWRHLWIVPGEHAAQARRRRCQSPPHRCEARRRDRSCRPGAHAQRRPDAARPMQPAHCGLVHPPDHSQSSVKCHASPIPRVRGFVGPVERRSPESRATTIESGRTPAWPSSAGRSIARRNHRVRPIDHRTPIMPDVSFGKGSIDIGTELANVDAHRVRRHPMRQRPDNRRPTPFGCPTSREPAPSPPRSKLGHAIDVPQAAAHRPGPPTSDRSGDSGDRERGPKRGWVIHVDRRQEQSIRITHLHGGERTPHASQHRIRGAATRCSLLTRLMLIGHPSNERISVEWVKI